MKFEKKNWEQRQQLKATDTLDIMAESTQSTAAFTLADNPPPGVIIMPGWETMKIISMGRLYHIFLSQYSRTIAFGVNYY